MDPTTSVDRVVIRSVEPSDADAVARLSGELGYPVAVERMAQRLASIAAMPDHAVFVAETAGEVLGWIHVSAVAHLQSEPRAEIGGLVITGTARGQRIGARLVARAEAWAREHGFASILVRSQIARDDAHRFYLREGYERTKTSAVFTKTL
ncbi:MAG: GNAT family N-acetyltransferase [Acidobacteria bacterium]|nr:GNAT family N-acetyltransferase [Acidobacteriota bacterium]